MTTDNPRTSMITWLGAIALVVALPIFLFVPGVPFAAWALCVVLWLAGVAMHQLTRRATASLPGHLALAAGAGTMLARVWLSTGVLLFVGISVDAGEMTIGLGEEEIAVAALALFTLVFTLDLVGRIVTDVRDQRTRIATGTVTGETPA